MTVREKEVTKLPPGSDPPRTALSALVDRLIGPFRRGTPPPKHQPMGFYTDTSLCIGCKACEVACKQWNQLPADGFQWTGNSHDNTGELSATSWRHVKFIEQLPPSPIPIPAAATGGDGTPRFSLNVLPSEATTGRWLMMSDVCKHCVAAPCQQACPTGAIIHNEFENVYIQQDICNGCSYCIAACPFGVITRASLDGHSHKCTLCYDRQRDGLVPACAKACPTQSIQFGPVDELRERARKRVEELNRLGESRAHLYGDAATKTYSNLNSFYLLLDRPSVYGLPEAPFNPWLHMWSDYARGLLGAAVAVVVLVATFVFLGG